MPSDTTVAKAPNLQDDAVALASNLSADMGCCFTRSSIATGQDDCRPAHQEPMHTPNTKSCNAQACRGQPATCEMKMGITGTGANPLYTINGAAK